MISRKNAFSKEHHLSGLTVVKLWGMAISSVKDLVATFTTVHPSSQPEYLIQSDYCTMLSVVSIGSQPTPAKFVAQVLRENLTSETIAHSVKFWLKHLVDSPDKHRMTIHEMMAEFDREILRLEKEPMSVRQPTASLNTLLYHSKILKAHRMKRLVSLFDPSLDSATSASLDMAIVAQLTTTILRLPRKSWRRSIISKYIVLEFKKAVSMLPAGSVHEFEDLDLGHAADKEQCEICEAEIPLEAFTEARCVEGHEFGKLIAPLCSHSTFHANSCDNSSLLSYVPRDSSAGNIEILWNLRQAVYRRFLPGNRYIARTSFGACDPEWRGCANGR